MPLASLLSRRIRLPAIILGNPKFLVMLTSIHELRYLICIQGSQQLQPLSSLYHVFQIPVQSTPGASVRDLVDQVMKQLGLSERPPIAMTLTASLSSTAMFWRVSCKMSIARFLKPTQKQSFVEYVQVDHKVRNQLVFHALRERCNVVSIEPLGELTEQSWVDIRQVHLK